jgi:hypothetical protein
MFNIYDFSCFFFNNIIDKTVLLSELDSVCMLKQTAYMFLLKIYKIMLKSNKLDGLLVKQNEVSQDSYLCFRNVFEKTLK